MMCISYIYVYQLYTAQDMNQPPMYMENAQVFLSAAQFDMFDMTHLYMWTNA